jgi:hypothetical protein
MIEVGLTLQQLTCQADSTNAPTKARVYHGTWVEPCSQADSSPWWLMQPQPLLYQNLPGWHMDASVCRPFVPLDALITTNK